MPYVNQRWLGGMLTNFQTISKRLARLRELEAMESTGTFDVLPKKEVLKLRKEKETLEKNLGGIRDMTRLPSAIFVISGGSLCFFDHNRQNTTAPKRKLTDTIESNAISHVVGIFLPKKTRSALRSAHTR